MWKSENESVGGREYGDGVLSSSQHGVETNGFERKDQSWYVASDIPSDVLLQVGDVSFHLHKYPLLSRSGRMNRLIYESRDAELKKIIVDDLPGGADAFVLAAKFCYGIAVDLTVANISGLRCAAEYLEMTEDLEEGNLIFKTEAFLSYVVLSSWRDSILVLKSCEPLSPWAENLQIVRRCSESIAWKACANPRGIRWAYTGRPTKVSSPSWIEMKESSPNRNQQVPPDWWFEDVSILRIDHFVRVITAIKVKGMRFELIGAAIMHYASKWLPGLIKAGMAEEASNSRDNNDSWRDGLHMIVAGNKDDPPGVPIREQRMIIESLISIIPPQKDSVTCSFLLRLLRMANMLKVAPALVTELEKRVGMQFEQATLPDLLIPSYNKSETLYDVDLVHRLLEHFLVQEQAEPLSPSGQSFSEKQTYEGNPRSNPPNAKMRVARLVDSYLTEVARDRNLSLTKFQVLAEALPESARTCDDGLYRAVDSFIKAHPTLSEHERKRLCRVMDCQKLSMDACMHAAQNERLPLRVVMQVLFSEQVKISNAIANNSLNETGESHYQPIISARKALLEGTPQSFQEGWATAKKDINTLKFELESIKTKYLELQHDMENMQRQFDKMPKQKQSSAWTTGWKKLSKFTKMTALETQDIGSQMPTAAGQTRKPTRRWRNSIS
ncbi:root phototropism protein 3-like [Telopea speciosissima]|uniref:root phototropism protein 3-like n=1 Tax=Telopea speciosissima TaxID=54955 RepID=UPI001CC5A5D6|nr:root phototropism protein 3-like [Telopea speciosissima]